MNPFASLGCRLITMLVLSVSAFRISSAAESLQPLELPPPGMEGGRPLMQVLKERQSKRDFSSRTIEPQLLSDLLWAAFGVNRPENDHRTAPSAMNAQEIDLYVVLAQGAYVYEAKAHRLRPVVAGDHRAKTGGQDFVKVAPIALVFVADLARMVKAKPEVKEPYAWVDTGYVSQNVYLFCASAGLATVVHELGQRAPLAAALQLRPDQKITLAQSVGYPGPPTAKKAAR